ncbi:ABC transporter ATP-binding protein [Frankia sp. Cr1]|uniref:ABC transporter ATP-binding protein n=1 Tax=Frankia sp. Cr1 TaxID=3073931 RepID=UPI002AD520DE|nr:ATP-binding cassette domain-containing protein [Frankia sp. Cr1]
MSSPAVLVSGLTVGFHGVPVVRDLDLEVHPGEVVALLGRNGAGKTTTLLTIAGDLTPQGGTVSVAGDARRRRLHQRARRGLGLLTEERCVFMDLTGHENLKLGQGDPKRALAFFPELEPHLSKRAGLLSGGQQQMLALARILAGRPRVLLADELSLGLAPLVVERLLAAIRNAAQDGAAVLLVEQHVQLALEAADRAYVLADGRIALTDTAATLLTRADDIASAYLGAEAV